MGPVVLQPHHESELHPSLHGHPITPPNVPPTSTAAAAAAPPARKRQRTTEPSAAEQVPYTVTVPHDEATTTSAPTKVVHTPAVVELQSSLAQDEAVRIGWLLLGVPRGHVVCVCVCVCVWHRPCWTDWGCSKKNLRTTSTLMSWTRYSLPTETAVSPLTRGDGPVAIYSFTLQ